MHSRLCNKIKTRAQGGHNYSHLLAGLKLDFYTPPCCSGAKYFPAPALFIISGDALKQTHFLH